MTNINWDDVLKEQANDPGIGAVPANKYPVRVKKAEAVTAQSGNPMIKVQLEITSGPYATRVVFTNIVFSTGNAKAMSFTLRKLGALGVTREVLAAQNPTTEQIASMIEGVEVEATVKVEQYNGEDKNDVAGFKALTDSTPAPPSVPGNSDAPPIPQVPTEEADAPDVPKAPF